MVTPKQVPNIIGHNKSITLVQVAKMETLGHDEPDFKPCSACFRKNGARPLIKMAAQHARAGDEPLPAREYHADKKAKGKLNILVTRCKSGEVCQHKTGFFQSKLK